MKKNDKRALTLRTETISNLSADALRSVNGGWTTIVISTANWTTIMSGTLSNTVSGSGSGAGGGGNG